MSVLPLKDFLTDFGYHPLFWPFALFVPFFLVFFGVSRLAPKCRTIAFSRYLAAAVALAFLGALGAAAWANLRSEAFPDHVQPSVAAISALFWKGQPVYQNFATPERYSLVYGPLLYAIIGTFQGLLGPTVFATKLPGTLAAFGALLCTFLAIARATDRLTAFSFTGLMAAMMLHSYHLAFSVRSDPFIMLVVAIGLLAATYERSRTAVVLGLCVGVAVNLKLHSLAYFLPIFALAWKQNWSRRSRVGACVAALIVILLPFLIFPQVSAANYAGLLKVAAKHGFGPDEYRGNIEWCVALAFPALFAMGIMMIRLDEFTPRFLRGESVYLAAFFVGFLLILIPASKLGAGRHHFLPFIPLALLFAARASVISIKTYRFQSAGPALAAALGCSWIACCSISTFRSAIFVYKTSRSEDAEARHCLADLLRARSEHADATLLVMPSGDDSYKHTFGRFRLIFEGTPIGIDPCALMDFVRGDAAEVDLLALTRTTMKRLGKPVLFLLPKDGEPFSMRTFYPPGGPLFQDKLRSDFNRTFWRIGSTEFFDLYQPRVSVLEGTARAL